MSKLLEALGGKVAERWLALLLGPSVLLMIVTVAGVTLGHRHWHDTGLLLDRLNRLSMQPALRRPGTLVLVLAGLLAASAAIGLAITALGAAVEGLWLATRPRRLTDRRRRRWDAAQERFNHALVEAGRAARTADAEAATLRARELNALRNRISLTPPTHPFWLGDRIAAVDTRVWQAYRLDLTSVWPRLWLTLPEDVRAEIDAARSRLTTETRLAAWALSYMALGTVWWPAAPAGVIAAVAAWRRTRAAAVTFAELVESAVDVHGRDLAQSLGLTCTDQLTPEVGAAITTLLRKQT